MKMHYLFQAWKSLLRYRYYSCMNVIGLATGMLSAWVIASYVGASFRLDDFHEHRAQIQAVYQQESVAGTLQPEKEGTYLGTADLLEQFPEVQKAAAYWQHVESLVIAGNEKESHRSFMENRIFMTDSTFFYIFTFSFLKGNAATAFARPNSVVLTEASARKYFGAENPLGKTLYVRTSWGQQTSYEISGVIENPVSPSRFRFDFLLYQKRNSQADHWSVPGYSMYALVSEGADIAALEQKLSDALRSVPELASSATVASVHLRALSDVRLSNTESLLAVVAILITVVCWVNYINQTIAQAYARTKQSGVLRILGATRRHLVAQFSCESMLHCILAFMLMAGLYIILEDWLRLLTNDRLLPVLTQPQLLVAIGGIFLLGGTAAAIMPVMILSRQKLDSVLRNSFTPRVVGIGIRKIFVVAQFSISLVLLVCLFVVSRQLDYMETSSKGFDMRDMLVIKPPMARDTTWLARARRFQSFKQQLGELAFVKGVASSTTVPGEEYRQETWLGVLGQTGIKALVHQNGIDENFFPLYDVQFAAGHNFIPHANARNRECIIINESAAKALGFSDYDKAVNARVFDYEEPGTVYEVIGVIRNYHQTSLKFEIRPLAFKFNIARGHCSLKLHTPASGRGQTEEQAHMLRTIWDRHYPDIPFDHFYVSESFREQDRGEKNLRSLFQAFTSLSALLSCLGLFALSMLISTRRQKEVGIRKTFGATSPEVLRMLLFGYLAPLIGALVLGSTCAWMLMGEWLTNYAYRIRLGLMELFIPAAALTAIFLVTVAYHTIRAARANPVDVLRN